LDRGVGVDPTSFASAWSEDAEARSVGGLAALVPVSGEVFVAGMVELVAIPQAVNLASSALHDTSRD
jgi:hypothetical protein